MVQMITQELLEHVSLLRQKQEKLALLSGENFNVFQILGLETREVRTHSAFLAELLSPTGSHGLGDTFLKLFLPLLDFPEFDASRAHVVVEQHIGQIDADYMQGGRIDLYLEAASRYIFIENKIYAGDQFNQLWRYHRHQPAARLVYLTLDGAEPPTWSTGQQLPVGRCVSLSYKHHIKQWLEACRQVTSIHPVVRETITQYLNLIISLTGGAANNLMKEQVSLLLQQDTNSFEAAAYIAELFPVLKQTITQALWNELDTTWETTFPADTTLLPGYEVHFILGMDSKTHIGLQAHKDGKPVIINQDEALRPLLELVAQMQPRLKPQYWWLGWRNLVAYAKTFDQMSPTELLTLRNDVEQRKQLFDRIIGEAMPDYQRFVQLASDYKVVNNA
jgi:hypothetical protein